MIRSRTPRTPASGARSRRRQSRRSRSSARRRPVCLGDDGGGSTQIIEALLKGIAGARSLIYVEHQYLSARPVVAALAQALRREPNLELDRRAQSEPRRHGVPAVAEREARRVRIAPASPDRHFSRCGVSRATPRHGGAAALNQVFVHSKVVIVDDLWATSGSANLDGVSLHSYGDDFTGAWHAASSVTSATSTSTWSWTRRSTRARGRRRSARAPVGGASRAPCGLPRAAASGGLAAAVARARGRQCRRSRAAGLGADADARVRAALQRSADAGAAARRSRRVHRSGADRLALQPRLAGSAASARTGSGTCSYDDAAHDRRFARDAVCTGPLGVARAHPRRPSAHSSATRVSRVLPRRPRRAPITRTCSVYGRLGSVAAVRCAGGRISLAFARRVAPPRIG